jgi:hypothetical protein
MSSFRPALTDLPYASIQALVRALTRSIPQRGSARGGTLGPVSAHAILRLGHLDPHAFEAAQEGNECLPS